MSFRYHKLHDWHQPAQNRVAWCEDPLIDEGA